MSSYQPSVISEFILYNNWANQKILETCRSLDEDQLAFNAPGTYGSIRATLEHLVQAESWYVSLLTGNELKPSFEWAAQPDLALLMEYSRAVGEALVKAGETVKPTDIVQEVDNGKTFHYQAIVVLIQAINHGIEHRTNITTALAQMKLNSPKVDGWGYFDTHTDKFIFA